VPFTSYTLADLRTQLAFRWDSSPFWSQTDADRAINESLLLWNALTGYWKQRITITIPANDPYATVPGTMVQHTAVSIGGLPLSKGSLFGLSMARPNWRRETIATTGLPTAPQVWAAISLNAFVIWPAMTTDTSVSVDGIRQTPRLVNAGDFLDIGDDTVNTLLGYALHAAALKAPASLSQRTQQYLTDFLEEAAEQNAALRATDWYKRIQRASRQNIQQPYTVSSPDDSGGPGRL
jgi:hypothetical protein